MTTPATAVFAIKSWDEKTWDGQPAAAVTGEKLTRAQVIKTYTGDLEGEGRLEYLMFYRSDGRGNYVGLEQVTGRIAGRSGNFMIQYTGTFDAQAVHEAWVIVPDSGTDELKNLSGQGRALMAEHRDLYPITFEYCFE
ncbi:MAG TPA: DUF3224 domain-containing protein [Phototrophicaceae bacterium]|nr:DUF3224 domain-containing protein [Phototrophicaceae bacterium]